MPRGINKETLIPQTERTLEEQRKIAKMGGIASGKARAKKKNLKEALALALEIMTEKTLKEAKEKKASPETIQMLKESGLIPYKLLEMLTSKKIKSETKLRVMQEIMDRTEGKALQKIESKNVNKNIDLSNISTDDLKNLAKQSKNEDSE